MIEDLYNLLINYGFDDKTSKRFSVKAVQDGSGCWLWQAHTGVGGYGRFQWMGKNTYAHRWIYEQIHGDAGESLDHICNKPNCVNPNHLQIVSRSDNTKLMFKRGPVKRTKNNKPVIRIHAIRKAVDEGFLSKEVYEILCNKDKSKDEAMRFAIRVSIDKNTGCWNWTGKLNDDGYAIYTFKPEGSKKHKHISGHKYAYTMLIGDPGKDLVLDHLCRNRACCNPYHLEPITRAENTKRADFKTRSLRITHCPQGHEYTAENTRITKRNQRCCRQCERDRANAKNTHCHNGHLFDLENTGYRFLSNGKNVRFCKICADQPRHRAEHCPKGHPYDELNTWIGKNGDRACRTCARIRANESKTHCAQGHKYTSDSFVLIKGVRRCIICKNSEPRYLKTHCPAGHEYTSENTGFRPRKIGNPYRYCIICDRKKAREYQQLKRALKLSSQDI